MASEPNWTCRLTAKANEKFICIVPQPGYRLALFKNMKSCSIVKSGDDLVIVPTHHDKLDSWSRSKDDGIEDVVLPIGRSWAQIGAAFRLALSRCTG